MIKITDKAAKKLKELRISENYSNEHNVRVKVKGGGCSGLLYDLNFDNLISETDESFEDKGVKIIVDKITIGEIDCLIEYLNKYIHLEIVYKFYLYDEHINTGELDHWIGPNRKDSLVFKLNKH